MEDYYYFQTSVETTADIPFVRSSFRNRSSPSRSPCPASSRDHDTGGLHHHYLHACFLCARVLARNKDTFMYRGDTPFCSEECRQQQIDTDEAGEKKSKKTVAATSKQQRQQQSPHRVTIRAR